MSQDSENKEETKEEFISKFTSRVEVIDDEQLKSIKATEEEIRKAKRFDDFRSKVPVRYKEVIFHGDPRLLTSQRSVIYGPYGTGKTYLGYAIAKKLYVEKKIETFCIAREREIYNTMIAYRENPWEYKKLYYDVDFLVIDEFGKNSNTESSVSQIFDIIDYRYDWMKKTVLICNAATEEELSKIVPNAIQDRFTGSTYKLDGKSRRKPE